MHVEWIMVLRLSDTDRFLDLLISKIYGLDVSRENEGVSKPL